MSLGDGIFWSTVLVILAAAIFQIAKHHKLKQAGKVVGLFIGSAILVGAIVLGGIAVHLYFEDRRLQASNIPFPIAGYSNVRIGMSATDIKLATAQEPEIVSAPAQLPDSQTWITIWGLWLHKIGVREVSDHHVLLAGQTRESFRAKVICRRQSWLFGASTEAELREKLGDPSMIKIAADELSQYMSFPQWRVTAEITAGKLSSVCISSSGRDFMEISYHSDDSYRLHAKVDLFHLVEDEQSPD